MIDFIATLVARYCTTLFLFAEKLFEINFSVFASFQQYRTLVISIITSSCVACHHGQHCNKNVETNTERDTMLLIAKLVIEIFSIKLGGYNDLRKLS